MSLSSQTLSETQAFDTSAHQQSSSAAGGIPLNALVSLGAVPMLLGLWGGKAIATLMRDIGQASEEVFRGDRLPVLNFPATLASEGELSDSSGDVD